MQAVLSTDKTLLELTFPYNPLVVGAIKRMPGRAFNAKTGRWLLPIDGLALQNFPKLEALGFDLTLARAVLNAPVITDLNAPSSPVWGKLYPFQARMASQIVSAGNCCVVSFCGSGKTITSLAALSAVGAKNVLVICPKSVLFNWQREITQWLNASSAAVSGSPAQRKAIYNNYAGGFMVTTYDQLRGDIEWYRAREWDAVVVDEAHYLVNTTSLRHKAVASLRAGRFIGLTATPIMNKATDVYGVMKAIGRNLGNHKLFLDRYCVKDLWGSIKFYQRMPELKARIQPWLVSCKLEDAGFDLPERTDTDLEFELSTAEASLYDRIRKELLFELETAEVSKLSSPMVLQNSLVKLGKLQELTDHCGLIGESEQSTKLEILKEHLENNLNENKAIIFTRFSRMAEILERELRSYSPVLLTGSTGDRQGVIDAFTSKKEVRLFISTEAGGAGINLQAANIIYNYDLPFSLGKLEQRHGRIRWHMQGKPVFFYNLLAKVKGKKSIDHWVLDKLDKKQEMSKLLLSDVKQALQ